MLLNSDACPVDVGILADKDGENRFELRNFSVEKSSISELQSVVDPLSFELLLLLLSLLLVVLVVVAITDEELFRLLSSLDCSALCIVELFCETQRLVCVEKNDSRSDLYENKSIRDR